MKHLSDWSQLPKDIYVIDAISHDGIGFDVKCCSVPMVTVPEVRYTRADLSDAATLKYCEEKWSEERGVMIDKLQDARAALRAAASSAGFQYMLPETRDLIDAALSNQT